MKSFTVLLASLATLAQASPYDPGPRECSAENIDIPPIFGLDVVSIQATIILNETVLAPDGTMSNAFLVDRNLTGLSYCNVTVTTRHPGYVEGGISTGVYLPLKGWNERICCTRAIASGWATVSSSVGISVGAMANRTTEVQNSDAWALRSTGNVDLEALADFGYRALGDAAAIGKAVVESFYGKPPRYRYWNGCSTGGRQALMLAQRYPDAYHGLLGSCPAINWARFLSTDIVPQLVMRDVSGGHIPAPCEFRAITAAALEECDGLDGVVDGYVTDPKVCKFNASSVLGKTIDCPDLPGGTTTISKAAVAAAEAAWAGYHTVDGEWRYYGVSRTTNITGGGTLASTACQANGTCNLAPFGIANNWVKNFLMKDLEADPMALTLAEFDRLWQVSVQEWASFLATDDPDLRPFHKIGGKLLVWHGLDDIQIYAGGTEEYYNRVLAVDSNATDYIRFFQAPGIGHCSGGAGAYPGESLQSLIDWVEKNTAPNTLYGRTATGKERPLCLYPKKVVYNGGKNTDDASSYNCVEGFAG
ncbi:Carboxylic ester hydrolase [Fusarium sp. LHS14.1]|nr:Carboxylic ester hydrolase [Fusarium sp. LHS14.1]